MASLLVASLGALLACSSDGDASEADSASGQAPPGGEGTSPENEGQEPGSAICEEGLPMFGHGVKYTVASTREMTEKAEELDKKGGEGENVWIVDTTHCRTYFKVNKYVVRIDSVYDDKGAFPKMAEAGTVVGRQEGDQGTWTFDVGKQSRSIVLVGTEGSGLFKMGGFPYGVSLGALVIGSTQTYDGPLSNTMLPKTREADAARTKAIWDRLRQRMTWDSNLTVIAHSAGSVPAENLVMEQGGVAYLYGTPRFTDKAREDKGAAKAAGNSYVLRIANHDEDPVSGSYRCADAYYSCKGLLRRSDAKDPDAATVTCALGKDPYCTKIVKDLGMDSWAPHNYSDMTVNDPG